MNPERCRQQVSFRRLYDMIKLKIIVVIHRRQLDRMGVDHL
jgi:hypothetical protein